MEKSVNRKRLSLGRLAIATLAVVVIGLSTANLCQPMSFAALDDEVIELNTLINESAKYDGKKIHVRGEAIIEALERGESAWVNINDGTNAIGVLMPIEIAKQIKYFGDYKNKGDILDMEVIMNRSCQSHGGDLDLHLVNLYAIKSGHVKNHELSPVRIAIAGIALLTMAATGGLYWWNRQQ